MEFGSFSFPGCSAIATLHGISQYLTSYSQWIKIEAPSVARDFHLQHHAAHWVFAKEAHEDCIQATLYSKGFTIGAKGCQRRP